MRLNVIENALCKEPAVTVEFALRTQQVDRVIHFLEYVNQAEHGLQARLDGEQVLLNPDDVLYIESIDRKTFCYTCAQVYETDWKLYELEEQYGPADWIRVSKGCIVNLQRIQSIRPDFGAKLLATMDNGEKVFISRQYAPILKEKLGLGGKR